MTGEQVSALLRLYEKHGYVDRCRTCGHRSRVVYNILDMSGECLKCRIDRLKAEEEAEETIKKNAEETRKKNAEETRKKNELFLKDFAAL